MNDSEVKRHGALDDLRATGELIASLLGDPCHSQCSYFFGSSNNTLLIFIL